MARTQLAAALVAALALSLLPLAGAWADAPPAAEETLVHPAPDASHAYDEYDELYFDDEPGEQDDNDPIEGFNRGVFWVNDSFDRFLLEPVATAFDYAVPDFAQRALRNAFDNLRFPILVFNNLFQGKPKEAGVEVARFVMNSSVGLGGLMDPASSVGLRKGNEDFGQTLGYWGVPPGPYLMLPFFGPSNVRDAGGMIVDTAFRAFGFFIPFVASLAMQGVDTINRRSLIRREIQAERKAALDWYAAVRSAYSQYRENLVQDRRQATDSEDDELGNYYPVFDGDAGS